MEGFTNLPKIWKPPKTSGRQKGDKKHNSYEFFPFPMVQQPLWARAKSLSSLHDHTPHSVRPLWTTSPTQRPLPDTTWHSQGTDIHAPGRIRTRHPSKWAAYADPRLRRRGYWNIHMAHPRILGATVKDSVSRATWCPRPGSPDLLWLSQWHYWECSTTESKSSIARMEKSWINVVSICSSVYVDRCSFILLLPI
jgi:hypothetical protein